MRLSREECQSVGSKMKAIMEHYHRAAPPQPPLIHLLHSHPHSHYAQITVMITTVKWCLI